MKLLITGATGFLGSHMMPILRTQFDEIETIGRAQENIIHVDISKDIPNLAQRADVVLHAAGKAHVVPTTPEEEKEFFEVNLQGTINLCKGLESVGVPSNFIFVSTVAVYGLDSGELIDETYPLAGTTPYALSKIQAEQYLARWCSENGVVLTILRPSLIAGENAPGNLGAMVKGIKGHRYFDIAGGKAKKSVIMAQDLANVIPFVLGKGGTYNICDDYNPEFGELSSLIAKQLGMSSPMSLPYWFARCLAGIGSLIGPKFPITVPKLKKITSPLTFSSRKLQSLGWQPLNVLDNYHII